MASLHAACFTTPRPWTETEFRALSALPGSFVECAASGFAVGRVVADEAELLTLAVDPDARRQGIGRALLERFEAAARMRGAAKAFLEVGADNPAARALYDSAGFRPAGRRKGYYRTPDGKPIDALILTKSLA